MVLMTFFSVQTVFSGLLSHLVILLKDRRVVLGIMN